jgi:hypothetical protein
MSGIPVHLQRRFEQRWAARFVTTNTSPLPPSIELQMALHPIGGGSMPSLLP